ncbi:MAG: rRNA maturation RNase YbeY [Deltaproteobacteria bacterium]|nr:MAG: rRNA maturation RNase YbeY [Deltaproteobacteria bacterium]
MQILLDNRQKKIKINRRRIKRTAERILKDLGCPDKELSLVLLDDYGITRLNKEFFRREGPTNVISFPMSEGPSSAINPQLLGDVVISLERAQEEAKKSGTPFEERLDYLLIHGILHLLGYDHQGSKTDARRMRRKQKKLFVMLQGMAGK